ncbi:hypothetical protein BBJ28_00001215 [Nothophytophthora sp. Chile5]|nr:hypothetical protein BBJ28_00001215 [Nothophytophthora sp. Chile5]
MRGGKMDDYSEFEEEDGVDLQNLIGTKPAFGAASSALGKSHRAAKTSPTSKRQDVIADDDDEFDADF